MQEAHERGEGVAYLNALSQAAKALSDVSDEELHRRLVVQAERFVENRRWLLFIEALMLTDCNRKLPWRNVADLQGNLARVLGQDGAVINLALAPGAPREQRQIAAIQSEKEMPHIARMRMELVDRIIAELYELTPRTPFSAYDHIREALQPAK